MRSFSYQRRFGSTLLLLVSLKPGLAWSADNGIYLGGSLGDPSSDYRWSNTNGPEDDGRGFKAIIGARPFDWLAIEGNYTDLGTTLAVTCPAIPESPCREETFDARAVSVSVLGLVALPLIDLYARAGVARWDAERQIRFGPEQPSDGSDTTYGAGVQARIGSFALRAEYERFDFGADKTDLVSVGFTYTFL